MGYTVQGYNIYIYICMCISMYVCIYVHAYMLGNGWIWKGIHHIRIINIHIYSCYERDVQV